MLSGQDVPLGMDEGMVRLAEAIGRELAYVDLDDMNKEAGIGSTAGNLFKSVGGSIAKGLSAPKVSGTIKNITSGVKATIGGAVQSAQQGVKNVAAKAQQGLSQISGRLQQFGQQSAPSGTPEWMQQKGVLGQSPGKTTGSKPMETSGPAQAPGTQSSTAPFQDTAPNAGAGQGPGQPPPPQQAQPSAPSLQEIADRAGLSNGRWKTKLPMLGAAALGTYGLIQGAKKISDTLSTESKPAQYNQGGATPAFGVNEWGVADRNTPFG